MFELPPLRNSETPWTCSNQVPFRRLLENPCVFFFQKTMYLMIDLEPSSGESYPWESFRDDGRTLDPEMPMILLDWHPIKNPWNWYMYCHEWLIYIICVYINIIWLVLPGTLDLYPPLKMPVGNKGAWDSILNLWWRASGSGVVPSCTAVERRKWFH